MDLALAAVVTLFGVLSVLFTHPAAATGVDRDADALAVAFGVLATAPLALRRSAPLLVVAVTSIGIVLAAARGYPVAAGGLGPTLATTSAAYLTGRRGAIVAGVTFAVATFVATHLALGGDPGEGVQLTTSLIIAALATLAGDVLRTLHQRNRELDALRAVEAREAVAQERVRIARDVHDVVGHALVAITLQARAGRRLLSAIRASPARRCARSTSWPRARWARPGRRSAASANPRRRSSCARNPAWRTSTSSSRACRRTTCGSSCAATATSATCRRSCRRRPTGSSRRRSATSSSTPGPRPPS
jgi:hypothetical protein